MSVSGISSTFMNQNIDSIQNQQQKTQAQFLQLAQEFQQGSFTPSQASTLQNTGLQTAGASSSQSAAPSGSANVHPGGHPLHGSPRHHIPFSSNDLDADPQTAQDAALPSPGLSLNA